jgi:hypothetical protein
LATLTPSFQVRATGFGASPTLRITMLIATTSDFVGGVVVDSSFVTSDTVVTIQVTHPLPSEAQVFWKARVSATGGATVETPAVGPRLVPAWLTLVYPNSPAGDQVDVRRPLFVWKSARVSPVVGPWKYDVQITSLGRPEQGAAALTDTTWRAIIDLQSNTSYLWSVRAYLPGGAQTQVFSNASFLVKELTLPARTLIYQNFPNPFPSPTAFATCIWFDVAEPGARISLDVTDLRGNLVRTLIPGSDGQRDFQAGQYGRGQPGAGSNCDNRFVWDGTGSDGRTVAAGVYLLRFQAGRQAPTFLRVLFSGR